MKLATLCYVRAGGKTLMLHRVKKPNDMHAGKWNGLGGKLEAGETPEECVIREVYEESGLNIQRPELKGVLTFPAFNDDEDWYAFVYVAKQFSGTMIESPEGVLAWIDDHRLPELNLWAGDLIFLRWLEGKDFFSAKFVYQQGELTNYDVVFYTRDGPVKPVMIRPSALVYRSYNPDIDDNRCWLCDGPAVKRHCKIICLNCGFTRDCSDP